MRKRLYCKKELINDYFSNKVGYFSSEDHFDKNLKSLSNEEYIEVQNSFCVCSDEGDD